MIPSNVMPIAEGFWNIRGQLKIGGLLNVGTHASLIRRDNGKYLLLDACEIDAPTRGFVDEHTRGGEDLEAVLHLHPFHTLFVRSLHQLYPAAKLYGTARHLARFQDLPWQPERTEDELLHRLFSDDLDFTVPRGVDFIPRNENLHFSSVLAVHRPSQTLHVDDTLCFVRLPKPLSLIKEDLLGFHPSLGGVLQKRPGAAAELRAWMTELVERARTVNALCAAHSAIFSAAGEPGGVARRIQSAVQRAERKLRAHEKRYG